MEDFKYLWLVITLVLFECNLGESKCKKACDIYDSPCVTKAFQYIYESFLEPMDPIHKDKISGDVDNFHYDATNITLSGVSDCKVELLEFIKDENTPYLLHLHCSKLLVNSHFGAKGKLFLSAQTDFDGKGRSIETLEDYFIIIKGKYNQYTSKRDHKTRLVFTDYHVETEFRGKYSIDISDFDKEHQKQYDDMKTYFNNMGTQIDPYLRSPLVEVFLSICMETLKKYQAAFPMDEVYSLDLD